MYIEIYVKCWIAVKNFFVINLFIENIEDNEKKILI